MDLIIPFLSTLTFKRFDTWSDGTTVPGKMTRTGDVNLSFWMSLLGLPTNPSGTMHLGMDVSCPDSARIISVKVRAVSVFFWAQLARSKVKRVIKSVFMKPFIYPTVTERNRA
jgi:hypothetical protein